MAWDVPIAGRLRTGHAVHGWRHKRWGADAVQVMGSTCGREALRADLRELADGVLTCQKCRAYVEWWAGRLLSLLGPVVYPAAWGPI